LGSLVLLAVGVITLLRIIRRNAVTDGYIAVLAEMRRQLAPNLSGKYVRHFEKGKRKWSNGGHAYVVSVLNSALGAAVGWSLAELGGLATYSLLVGGVVGFLALSRQLLFLGKSNRATAAAGASAAGPGTGAAAGTGAPTGSVVEGGAGAATGTEAGDGTAEARRE